MRKNQQFQLSQQAVEKLAAEYGTPLLVLSLEDVKRKYNILKKYLPRVKVHYAIKANPHQDILRTMIDMGSCFDVASDGEIRLLNSMGVTGDRMIYANPVKLRVGLEACVDCGVRKMTFDTLSELKKIKAQCPDAILLYRLRIDNSSAHVDLNKKFGGSREDAIPLMLQAKEMGMDIAGIAFHVGSQTVGSEPYLNALDIVRGLYDDAREAGLDLRVMDIGGGMPIREPKVKFNLPEILSQINARLEEDFAELDEIWCEPGRYICGDAVNLITSVVGVSERGGQPWYWLDEGLYGTFSGVIFDQWDFKLISFKQGAKKVAATFAGPSCDSLDIMFRGRMTVPLEMDDLLLVPACGAYTSASATTFNGFSKARYITWEDVKDRIEPVAPVGKTTVASEKVAQAL